MGNDECVVVNFVDWRGIDFKEEMTMKKLLLLIALLCLLVVGSVSALNMTITDLGIVGRQTVQIYSGNGSILAGTYNTTSAGILLPTDDFVLLVKPDTTSVISDPTALLNATFAVVQTNVIPIVIILFFIGLVFRR